MANPIITKIQVEGNDVVSFLNGTDYVRSMSQILPQNPTYISYRYDSITISQVAGEAFTFSIYTVTEVGGNTFTELTIQDAADIVQARTVEIYRLLVTSIFKGCCECGNTEPECSIQYTAAESGAENPGIFVDGGLAVRFNYFTANNQDFTGFWPIIQDGSWVFIFSKTDPTVYGVYQLSNYSDGGTYAQFDSTLITGPAGFPAGTSLCVDVTSVGGSLVQDWQDTLNISSVLTQDNNIDGGGFTFQWDNVLKYILNSTSFQQYQSADGSGGVGEVKIDPGAVTISGTGYIDIITPNYASASTGWVLALDASGHVEYVEAGTGTISSIELIMPPAFTVSDPNPLTTDGAFTVTVDGTVDQYINGLGELADFPVYTVENGLHAFGGVPGEAPPDPFLFHLGGLLVEDTTITVTNGAAQYALGVAGLAGQNTQQPFGVSNLGDGGVATFQDYGSSSRNNPSVEIVGDVDLYQPLLELRMEGNLPNPNPVLADRLALLRLKYDGDPALAKMSIDYQFKNDDTPPNTVYFIGCRLTAELTDFTANNEQSKFLMQLVDQGSRQTKMEMSGPGQLTLNEYATGSFSNGATNINNTLSYVLGVDNTGKVWKTSAGTGTVISINGAGLITTSPNPITTIGTVTTNMATNRLVGRYSPGSGIMQEITIGAGLALSAGGELTADGSVPAFDGDQGVYKDTSLPTETFMLGAPLGSETVIAFEIDRYIYSDIYKLALRGAPADSAITTANGSVLEVSLDPATTGSFAAAIKADTTNSEGKSIGIMIDASSLGLYINSQSESITTYSPGSSFIGYVRNNNFLNEVIESARFIRDTVVGGGSPSVGFGTSINFELGDNNFIAASTSSGIQAYYSNVTPGSQSSDMAFRVTMPNGFGPFSPGPATALIIKGAAGEGQIQLPKYTTSTAFQLDSGASIGVLNVDDLGNVFVGEGGGGGGTYTVNNGLEPQTLPTPDPNNFQLGGPLVRNTTVTGASYNYELLFDQIGTFQVYAAGRSRLHNEGPGATEYTEINFNADYSALEYSSLTSSYQSQVAVEGSTGVFTKSTISSSSPFGVVSIVMGTNPSGSANGMYITTPNVSAGTATVGQVLTLKQVGGTENGRVEFEDAGGGGAGLQNVITNDPILTANNTITGVGLDLKFDQLLNFEANATGTVKAYSFSGVNIASLEINTVGSPFVDIYSTQSGGGFTGITLRDTRMEIKTPLYTSKTAGDVLTLVDPLTGEAEWETPTGGGGIPFAVASGTDTYTATVAGVTAYADGDAYLIRFTNGNTDSATLNINSLGAIPLHQNNQVPLIGGDIWDGGEMLCIYNATDNSFECIGTSPNSLFAYVTNVNGSTITRGQAVIAFGGTGNRMTVKLAQANNDANSAQTIGFVFSTSINNGQKGIIIIQGYFSGLNLFPPASGWVDGDPVYLSPTTAGAVTRTKPYAPSHLVYLGVVATASPGSAGRMYVRVQNGYELDELHNVQAQSPNLNDTIRYDTADSQWKTASVPSLSGTFSIGVTVDGSGGTITAGVKGYVRVPYACTINTWSILTGNSGAGATITFDIWRANNAIPTAGSPPLIGAGGTKPFLTSNTSQITSGVTSTWAANTLAANDILAFNVETGAAVFSWANLQLLVTKS